MNDNIQNALKSLSTEYDNIKAKSDWSNDDIRRKTAVQTAYNILKEYTNTSPKYNK